MEERAKTLGGQPPKIFHVNWFRRGADGKFLWPGYGENIRVLDWIIRRVNDEPCYKETAIGKMPTNDALNFNGLPEEINTEELFSIPKDFWLQEVQDMEKYFDEQVGSDLPPQIALELSNLKQRIEQQAN